MLVFKGSKMPLILPRGQFDNGEGESRLALPLMSRGVMPRSRMAPCAEYRRGEHRRQVPGCGWRDSDDIAARFTGAKAELVPRHLDILEVMGEVMQNPDGRFQGAA